MDKLEQIMSMQAELQRRLGTNFSELDPQERAEFMRNHRGYLEDELAEALYEMPFYKLWKNYRGMTEEDTVIAWQKVRMELVDCLHFFVNLMLCAGMTANEVYEMYMAKNKENHRRQDAGYTADVSYRNQTVEEVMDEYACTVTASGITERSKDFVVFMRGEDKSVSHIYNTDISLLITAKRMLEDAIEVELDRLPQDTRIQVKEALVNE